MQATAQIDKNEVLLNSAIKIYLTDEQLQAFRNFQDYYQDLVVMLDSGVFSFQKGQAVIHRDDKGMLQKIDINLVKYRRGDA